MSLQALKKIEVENSEHDFKYQLGEVVYMKNDLEFKVPMIILDFIPDESCCSDYEVSWMNKQGSIEYTGMPEECLIKKTENNGE